MSTNSTCVLAPEEAVDAQNSLCEASTIALKPYKVAQAAVFRVDLTACT